MVIIINYNPNQPSNTLKYLLGYIIIMKIDRISSLASLILNDSSNIIS